MTKNPFILAAIITVVAVAVLAGLAWAMFFAPVVFAVVLAGMFGILGIAVIYLLTLGVLL